MKKVLFAAIILIVTAGMVHAQTTVWFRVESRDSETQTLFDAMVYRDLSQREGFVLVNEMRDADFRIFFTILTKKNNADRLTGYVGSHVIAMRDGETPILLGYFLDSGVAAGGPNDLPWLKDTLLEYAIETMILITVRQ